MSNTTADVQANGMTKHAIAALRIADSVLIEFDATLGLAWFHCHGKDSTTTIECRGSRMYSSWIVGKEWLERSARNRAKHLIMSSRLMPEWMTFAESIAPGNVIEIRFDADLSPMPNEKGECELMLERIVGYVIKMPVGRKPGKMKAFILDAGFASTRGPGVAPYGYFG